MTELEQVEKHLHKDHLDVTDRVAVVEAKVDVLHSNMEQGFITLTSNRWKYTLGVLFAIIIVCGGVGGGVVFMHWELSKAFHDHVKWGRQAGGENKQELKSLRDDLDDKYQRHQSTHKKLDNRLDRHEDLNH